MNSQVRNTLTVLTLSSALVLGLLVVAPAAYPVAEVGTKAPVAARLAASFQDTDTTSSPANPIRRKSGKTNRIRQSMAMPFFSFAPRG